jgi:hypothetical protein
MSTGPVTGRQFLRSVMRLRACSFCSRWKVLYLLPVLEGRGGFLRCRGFGFGPRFFYTGGTMTGLGDTEERYLGALSL